MQKNELMQWQQTQLARLKQIEETIGHLHGSNCRLANELREDAISICLTTIPTIFSISLSRIETERTRITGEFSDGIAEWRKGIQMQQGLDEDPELTDEEEQLYKQSLE